MTSEISDREAVCYSVSLYVTKMACTFGGYDCKFVEEPPDDLICLICTFVAKDPQQVTCCGKIFCGACLEEQKKHSRVCPQCRGRGQSFEDKKSNRSIKQLKVRCSNTARGCEWIGELQALNKHSDECQYRLVRCPNRCMHKNRKVRKLVKDLDEHLQSECPNRTLPGSKIQCTNTGCRCYISRDELFIHRDQCPFERVPCKHAHLGCMTEVLRKYLQRHETNTQVHNHLTAAVDNSPMLPHVTAVAQPHFTFKVADFNSLKSKDMAYYSPPFYSHHGGYKLCLRVDANGWSTAHNTHISAQVYLMSGQNDDHLQWPFMGQIRVTLLNQLGDDGHHEHMFLYLNQRVRGVARGTLGYGPLRYISHDNLEYKSALNCQYLKNDCLFFRVIVDAPKNT